MSADRRIADRAVLDHHRRMSEAPASIVVYTRPFCIWCWKVKRLLRRRGLTFEERSAASPEARRWLRTRTGSPTVPQVFAGEELVGGFEATRAWVG